MHRKYYILHLLMACVLTACTPAVREAKSVVAQADSLWHAGMPCGDSIALAQAFTTLDTYQYLYPDDYAHACYHYGRLLREKENPVEAMQVFIHATHSHTRDYHILGRVYSNMGDICHLANEFDLSYDMFERSGEMYLLNKDSLLYYYDLNNMAFELAEQGKKDETLTLIADIENNTTNEDILARIYETKAELYLQIRCFDSTIYYAQKVLSIPNVANISNIQLAQAYSLLSEKDSAIYYAQKIISNTNNTDNLFALNNALYILTNDDKTKNLAYVREKFALRSDIQKLLEIRQGKLSQAVQLLQQDLNREPNMAWLYAVCLTIFLIGLSIFVYTHRKRKLHQLLSQRIEDLENKNEKRTEEMLTLINEHCRILRSSPNLKEDLCWKDFDKMCGIIDKQFNGLATKLLDKHVINETSVRLCILTLIGVDRKTISNILPYALNSVGKLKDETAKSLGTTGKNLRQYLINLAIEG